MFDLFSRDKEGLLWIGVADSMAEIHQQIKAYDEKSKISPLGFLARDLKTGETFRIESGRVTRINGTAA